MKNSLLGKLKVTHTHFPRLNEECGVFGVSGSKDAATLTALGFATQGSRRLWNC